MRRLLAVFLFAGSAALGLGLLGGPATSQDRGTSMVTPRYNEKGELFQPEGYRDWTFVGATLGLRYSEDGEPASEGPGTFHNIYIQPEAHRHFLEQGVFPQKTMLPMETYEPGTRDPKSGLTAGFFEQKFAGLSVAIKDSERFPEGWGYASFTLRNGQLAATAAPFPRERCYDCHLEHGARDNVFTQFYPVLNPDNSP